MSTDIKVTGPLAPNSPEDNYPTHEDIYGKGGLMVVESYVELLALPSNRLKDQMLVRIQQGDEEGHTAGDIFQWNGTESKWDTFAITTLINIVQVPGQSEEDIMSQKAVTDLVNSINSNMDLIKSFGIQGSNGVAEVGSTFGTNAVFEFAFSDPTKIKAESLKISQDDTIIVENGAVTSPYTSTFAGVTIPADSPVVFTMQVTTVDDITISKTYSVKPSYQIYYGASSETTLTEEQIKALSGKQLSTSAEGKYDITAAGYKYFVLPKAMDENLVITVSGFIMSEVNISEVTVTVNSVATVYNVHRSMNVMNGSVSMIVTAY